MKIVITDSATVTVGDLDFRALEALGEVTAYELTAPEQVAERVRGADAVLCNKTLLNRQTLAGVDGLKYIGLFATGYNNIDIPYANEAGITVCNAPGYSTGAVAQLTFAFIMELYNRVAAYDKTVRNGDWVRSRTFSYFYMPTAELEGKTIGIVGFGSIGQRVARLALAYGMRVYVHTRTVRDFPGVSFVGLDELLARSDIVTVHCPLTQHTQGMFGTEAFDKMKPGAVFINTSRGAVVDETALRGALKTKLLGAGIDVLTEEPMRSDCALLGLPNCLITPHIAWAGLETRRRLMGMVADNLRSFIAGQTINSVN